MRYEQFIDRVAARSGLARNSSVAVGAGQRRQAEVDRRRQTIAPRALVP